MNTDTIMQNVQDIFREVLDDQSLEVDEETTPANIKDWDSLSHVILITALEKKFKIKFKLDDLQKMGSIGEIVALIEKKLCGP